MEHVSPEMSDYEKSEHTVEQAYRRLVRPQVLKSLYSRLVSIVSTLHEFEPTYALSFGVVSEVKAATGTPKLRSFDISYSRVRREVSHIMMSWILRFFIRASRKIIRDV